MEVLNVKSRELVFYVGTRKLVCCLGETGGDYPNVIQYEEQLKPDGFQNGLVTNLEAAVNSIEDILERIYPARGVRQIAAYVVLGNSRLSTYSFSSSQYYQGFRRSISPHEVRSVIQQTRSVATLPLSEFILQAVPESFLINDMPGIRNPLGLEAHRLGVNLKIFTMLFQEFKNVANAFEAADIRVKGFFPKILTTSEAVLTEREKEEGVLVVDIADDMTQLVLWKGGCLAGTRVLPMGGKYLTQQIADRWKIEYHDAERVKERFSSLESEARFGDELIPLVDRNGTTPHTVRRQEYQEVFLGLARDWMAKIIDEVDRFAEEHKLLYPHFVYTGGGTSLEGFLEFLQRGFSHGGRIGCTRMMEAPTELLVDPALTSVLGMYCWLGTYEKNYRPFFEPQGFVERSLSSARDWLSAYF